jgi:hypothetical protein
MGSPCRTEARNRREWSERDVANIGGTVREDGSFGATIGFRPLTGNFAGDMFEGTFDIFGCAWKMILNMKKP